MFYYLCFPLNGGVECSDYVPVARFERFADCREQRNLYLRGPLRYWKKTTGANGNALCVETTTGRVWGEYYE